MKPRHRRIAITLGALAALGTATALALNAFNSNLVFFYSPTQVVNQEALYGRPFRLGGLVEAGSVKRDDFLGCAGRSMYLGSHFGSHDGKAASLLADTLRFDRGLQRQSIGLELN